MRMIIGIVGLQTQESLTGLLTLIGVLVAIGGIYLTWRSIRASNSIMILNWFDEEPIDRLLSEIHNRNSKKASEVEGMDEIMRLLYYLDTTCTLIRSFGVSKKYFGQMKSDFINIKNDEQVQAVYTANAEVFPYLDFDLLIKISKK